VSRSGENSTSTSLGDPRCGGPMGKIEMICLIILFWRQEQFLYPNFSIHVQDEES
jgi:hypothetical protein